MLVLDPVVEVSVSDPDVSVEVSVKLSGLNVDVRMIPPTLGELFLVAFVLAAVATGFAKWTCGRAEGCNWGWDWGCA